MVILNKKRIRCGNHNNNIIIITALLYCSIATHLNWQNRVLYKCVARLHLHQESDNERYHVAIEK